VVIYESKLGQCEKNNGYKRVKVFRNGLGYHFTRPINEQLVDQDGKVVCGEDLPLAIYHWGKYLEDERMKAKRERYVAQYSQALEKLPNDAYLHNLLANILNDLGRLDEALVHYDQAYTLAPDKEIGRQALEKKADLLLRQRKLREAAETAQHLLVISPDNLAARNVFASIYLVTGQVDKSIALLKETLAMKLAGQVENLYNSQAMPNFLLSKAYELKGDREAAAACLQEYRRIMGK
jgi:tetratricopeptide (TPR) repeat protein